MHGRLECYSKVIDTRKKIDNFNKFYFFLFCSTNSSLWDFRLKAVIISGCGLWIGLKLSLEYPLHVFKVLPISDVIISSPTFGVQLVILFVIHVLIDTRNERNIWRWKISCCASLLDFFRYIQVCDVSRFPTFRSYYETLVTL